MNLEKYVIAEESFDKKIVLAGLGLAIFTALSLKKAIKAGKARKEKSELVKRLDNLTAGEKESWQILVSKYNPIFAKIASEIRMEVKKALGPKASIIIKPGDKLFPKTQEIISGKQMSWISSDITIYDYDAGRITLASDISRSEADKIWETIIDPFLYDGIQEGIIEKYRKKYRKYASVFDINLFDMDHYGSVSIELKDVDSLGVLKPGLKEP